jgi:aspartyl aminopeptidase
MKRQSHLPQTNAKFQIYRSPNLFVISSATKKRLPGHGTISNRCQQENGRASPVGITQFKFRRQDSVLFFAIHFSDVADNGLCTIGANVDWAVHNLRLGTGMSHTMLSE